MRLARADTGTPVTEWLRVPVAELPEWCAIVEEEGRLLQREMEKERTRGRR